MNLRQNILQFLGDGQAHTCSDLAAAQAVAKRTYQAAVELFAMLCQKFSLDPLGDGVILKITAVRRTLPEPMTCASRMFAAPTRMKSSTFRQMPRKPTSLDSALSLTAHMTPVEIGGILSDQESLLYRRQEDRCQGPHAPFGGMPPTESIRVYPELEPQ